MPVNDSIVIQLWFRLAYNATVSDLTVSNSIAILAFPIRHIMIINLNIKINSGSITIIRALDASITASSPLR